MAGGVSDQINHHVWRGDRIDKFVVIRWAYIKELATMNTRERGGIEFIRLYTKGRRSKEWRGGEEWVSPSESVVGEWAYVKELAVMNTRGRGE